MPREAYKESKSSTDYRCAQKRNSTLAESLYHQARSLLGFSHGRSNASRLIQLLIIGSRIQERKGKRSQPNYALPPMLMTLCNLSSRHTIHIPCQYPALSIIPDAALATDIDNGFEICIHHPKRRATVSILQRIHKNMPLNPLIISKPSTHQPTSSEPQHKRTLE